MLLMNRSVFTCNPVTQFGGNVGMHNEFAISAGKVQARQCGGTAALDMGMPGSGAVGSKWILPVRDSGMMMLEITCIMQNNNLNAVATSGMHIEGASDSVSVVECEGSTAMSGSATVTCTSTVACDCYGIAVLEGTVTCTSIGGVQRFAYAQCVGAGAGAAVAVIGSYAKGAMSCNITMGATLSPDTVADSVWNSYLANFTTVGTMGERMNDVSGGGSTGGLTVEEHTLLVNTAKKVDIAPLL